MNKFFLKDIELNVQGEFEIVNRDDSRFITGLKPVLEAGENDLSFIANNRTDKHELLENSRGKIVLIDQSMASVAQKAADRTFIVVADPKLAFVLVASKLFKSSIQYSIHPTAVIHPEAKIHSDVFIGPHTYIGRATIDKGSIIYGNVHIYDNTTIGKDVKIHAGVIIGAEGFGYLTDHSGELVNFPHIGGVRIEDNVEIGANTCIDRGALGFTVIKRGAKIDNLVHIAHNVVVGESTMVIAHAMVGGSTIIGDKTWVAPSSSLRDAITIGNNVTIGMGAVVTKSVPDQSTMAGNPARPLKEFSAVNQALKKLINP